MENTMPPPIHIDRVNKTLRYPCACGRTSSIRFEDLVPDESLDYCGCGMVKTTFTADNIAEYYKGLLGPA
jgi:hypothetical protein